MITTRTAEKRFTTLCHEMIAAQLDERKAALAVDATCGNGFDSAFILERMAGDGLLISIDVQQAAIEATKSLLARTELENYRLFCQSHQAVHDIVKDAGFERLDLAVFNLGYLPGSEDRTIVTEATSSLPAIKTCLSLLEPQGVLYLTVYPGHPAGKVESEAIDRWLTQIAGGELSLWSAQVYRSTRNSTSDPYLIRISAATAS